MSLLSSPAYSLDSNGDLYRHSTADPGTDFFDQFLTFDSLDNEDSRFSVLSDSPLTVKPLTLYKVASSPSRAGEKLRGHTESRLPQEDSDFSHNWAAPQRPLTADYFDDLDKDAALNVEFLSLDSINLKTPKLASSPEPPESPSPGKYPIGSLRRKKRFTRNMSQYFRTTKEVDGPQRSPIRKPSSPHKLVRGATYSEQNLQHLSRRLVSEAKRFDFGFQEPNRPISPPPSARVSDASGSSKGTMQAENLQNGSFPGDHPVQQYVLVRHPNIDTPLNTPNPDLHSFTQQNGQASNHNALVDSQHIDDISAWIQDPLPAEYANFVATPYPEADSGDTWWSQTSAVSMQQTSSQPNTSQSTEPKTLPLHLKNDISYNAFDPSSTPSGLMIQMPVLNHSLQPGFVSPVRQHSRHQSSVHEPTSHLPDLACSPSRRRRPTSQPLKQRSFSSPLRKPRSQPALAQRTPSPSMSSFPPSSFSTPNIQVPKTRRMSRKSSLPAMPRTPRTPRTPKHGCGSSAAGNGEIEFMNFTPSDSRKILTGVAPSGSSKTKARREKEAAEKRRRLNEAAIRAVKAVGGSVEGLMEEGMLV